MTFHRRVQISVGFAKSLQILRRRLCPDFPFVQEIVTIVIFRNVVYPKVFVFPIQFLLRKAFERNGGSFYYSLALPGIVDPHQRVVDERLWLIIGVETKQSFYKGSICAKKTLSEIKCRRWSIAIRILAVFHPKLGQSS